MGWGIAGLLRIAHDVASWPGAVLAVPHMPPWGLSVLSLGIAWLGLWRTRVRPLGIAAILLGVASSALMRPPDLLVSADARLIGFGTLSGVFMEKQPGASNITLESFLSLWGVGAAQPMPGEGTVADGAAVCTPQSCRLRGELDALLLRTANGCDAALLVSAEPVRGDGPPALLRIDRFSVWHDGAYAAWLDGAGVRLLSDREYRGNRPWVPPDPAHARLPPGLLPVQTETLPDD